MVIDRIKDIATTSRGDRFSPQYIENKLKFSPYVAEAVVLGDGRPTSGGDDLHPLPHRLQMGRAKPDRLHHLYRPRLAARGDGAVQAEVAKVNAALPEPQRIQDFLLLYKELDADDDELTRTRKVRRGVINEKYGTIIEAMYRGDAAIPVDTTIAFQDGTKQRIRTTLKVVSMRPKLAMAAE